MANFLRGGVRLYSEPKQVQAQLDADDGDGTRTGEPSRSDNYLTTLLKLVPAEVVSVYMAVRDSATAHHALGLWFCACMAACVVVRAYASLPKTGATGWRHVQWIGVVVSCIAFLLWAFSMGADRPLQFLPLDQWLASALAGLFSLVAPLLVPADTSRAST